MSIIQLTPQSLDWPVLVEHLKQIDSARWVLDDQDQPLSGDLIFLAVLVDNTVIGDLTLIKRPVEIPHTEWAGDRERTLRDTQGHLLYETFVQTFHVAENHRRKGYGRALQEEALRVTRELGCIQMRSWSSLDKPANYQLKLSMGFGFHPEIQETSSGLKVSGGYFVKRV